MLFGSSIQKGQSNPSNSPIKANQLPLNWSPYTQINHPYTSSFHDQETVQEPQAIMRQIRLSSGRDTQRDMNQNTLSKNTSSAITPQKSRSQAQEQSGGSFSKISGFIRRITSKISKGNEKEYFTVSNEGFGFQQESPGSYRKNGNNFTRISQMNDEDDLEGHSRSKSFQNFQGFRYRNKEAFDGMDSQDINWEPQEQQEANILGRQIKKVVGQKPLESARPNFPGNYLQRAQYQGINIDSKNDREYGIYQRKEYLIDKTKPYDDMEDSMEKKDKNESYWLRNPNLNDRELIQQEKDKKVNQINMNSGGKRKIYFGEDFEDDQPYDSNRDVQWSASKSYKSYEESEGFASEDIRSFDGEYLNKDKGRQKESPFRMKMNLDTTKKNNEFRNGFILSDKPLEADNKGFMEFNRRLNDQKETGIKVIEIKENKVSNKKKEVTTNLWKTDQDALVPNKRNKNLETLKENNSELKDQSRPLTSIEKFRAILDREIPTDNEVVRGECATMAPESLNHFCDIFERNRTTNTPVPEWFVKKYQREGTDKNFIDPKQIRPLDVLRKTMDYLINNILDVDKKKKVKYALPKGRGIYRFDDIHNFLWKAFQSIKQDLSDQGYSTEKLTIQLLEEIARYHIIAINEGRDPEIDRFDEKLNIVQLTDTLTSLRLAYKEARDMANKAYHLLKDQPEFELEKMNQFDDRFYLSPNESEFLAYDIIMQLTNEKNPLNILEKTMTLPSEIVQSKEIQFGIRVATAVKENNYVDYFKLLNEADYLTSCVMSTLIKYMREKAIVRMSKSQNKVELVSINKFYELLAFEDHEEAYQFLKAYGLEEVSQTAYFDDDVQGKEGLSFKLTKSKAMGETANPETNKNFRAVKTAMNTRIIEFKRRIDNYLDTYNSKNEKDIYLDNDQIPRKFLVKGSWKKIEHGYYLRVLKNITSQPHEAVNNGLETKTIAKTLLDERFNAINKNKKEEERNANKQNELTPKFGPKTLFTQEQTKIAQPADSAFKKLLETPRGLISKSTESGRLGEIKSNQGRIQEAKEGEEIKKRTTQEIKKATKTIFEMMDEVLFISKKEILEEFESSLDYERDLIAFRNGILQNKKEYGLTSRKLNSTLSKSHSHILEEKEVEETFFSFLAETLSEQEPGLERYCYKAIIFHPLFDDLHFKLFENMLKFFTNNQESMANFDFEQLPVVFENQNIEFGEENESKKLCLFVKAYDEKYVKGDEKDYMKDHSDSELEEESYLVPSSDILSANIILFVLTKDIQLDKERFEPIYNAINTKKHYDDINVIFIQLYGLDEERSERKLKKQEIIHMLNLQNLYDKGLQTYFLKIPYFGNLEKDKSQIRFKDINYILNDKMAVILKKCIEDQISTKSASFFTLQELVEKLKISLEESQTLGVDYQDSSVELKAKVLHEMMSAKTIEAYYYVKNFLNHAVNSIRANFDFWYENIDRVAPEFLENYSQEAVDKIRNSKAEFDSILEKMLKINDIDDKYWKLLHSQTRITPNTSTVYSLIENKMDKMFGCRKKRIELNYILDILEKDFVSTEIGIKGRWKDLVKIIYDYYIGFLNGLKPVCILLDEDFKLSININALYNDVEKDIIKYNKWLEGPEYQNYDADSNACDILEQTENSLLGKRNMDFFSASESSIMEAGQDGMIEENTSSAAFNQLLGNNKTDDISKDNKSLLVDWESDKQFQTMKKIH